MEEVNAIVLEVSTYVPANLENLATSDKCDYLSKSQKEKTTQLLQKHDALFQGKRGKWKGDDVELRLKTNAKPCMERPRPIPLPRRSEFKKKLGRWCSEGILRKLPLLEVDKTEWGFPTFGAPKKDKK